MSEVQKKTLGLAIASLVCGCFFIIPILGALPSIAAVIMGIIALVTISKNKDTLKGSGLAIAGIVMGGLGVLLIPIMAIIGMLAAVSVPKFVHLRNEAYEETAVSYLHEISGDAEKFYLNNRSYPKSLSELNPGDNKAGTTVPAAMTVYDFDIIDTGSDSTFVATAVQKDKTGMLRSFCVTEDGAVRFDSAGKAIAGYYGCKDLEVAPSAAKNN